jgi:hypothetical protein
MDRRNYLVAAMASLLCTPAIVRASSLMPNKAVDWTPLASPVNEIWERGERPSAGWAERVGHQMNGPRFENRMGRPNAPPRSTAVFLKPKCGLWLPTRDGMAS